MREEEVLQEVKFIDVVLSKKTKLSGSLFVYSKIYFEEGETHIPF